jgi:hypothetical protein
MVDNVIMSLKDVSLRQTYFDFPEQYNAYIEDVFVGYIKINLGKIVVRDPEDDVIYIARTKGIETFERDERDFFLSNAKIALILSMMYNLEGRNSSDSKKYMYSAIQDIVCDGSFTIEECIQCYEIMSNT